MSTALSKSLVVQGSKYTDQDRQYVALLFVTYGNLQKVSDLSGIARTTLHYWKQSDWWNDLINYVRLEKKEELNANYQRLLDKTVKVIEKQLDTDEVKAMDAAKIHGIMFDKRQILNHMPTSISSTSNISDLAKQFDDYLASKTIEAERVIDDKKD